MSVDGDEAPCWHPSVCEGCVFAPTAREACCMDEAFEFRQTMRIVGRRFVRARNKAAKAAMSPARQDD